MWLGWGATGIAASGYWLLHRTGWIVPRTLVTSVSREGPASGPHASEREAAFHPGPHICAQAQATAEALLGGALEALRRSKVRTMWRA
jgi:hypothetical protein